MSPRVLSLTACVMLSDGLTAVQFSRKDKLLMKAWRNFWRLEYESAGWRFWIAWVILTNIGFFGGLAIGRFFAGLFTTDAPTSMDLISEAVIIGAAFATLTGLLQGILLQRHDVPREPWTLATGFGWIAGTLIAGLILFQLNPQTDTTDWFTWIIPVGFIAGAIVGIPQWLVLRSHLDTIGWWWIIVSAFAWGIFLPGLISGAVLAYFLPEQEYRRKKRKKKQQG